VMTSGSMRTTSCAAAVPTHAPAVNKANARSRMQPRSQCLVLSMGVAQLLRAFIYSMYFNPHNGYRDLRYSTRSDISALFNPRDFFVL